MPHFCFGFVANPFFISELFYRLFISCGHFVLVLWLCYLLEFLQECYLFHLGTELVSLPCCWVSSPEPAEPFGLGTRGRGSWPCSCGVARFLWGLSPEGRFGVGVLWGAGRWLMGQPSHHGPSEARERWASPGLLPDAPGALGGKEGFLPVRGSGT